MIGSLRDDEVAVIGNLVERCSMTENMNRQGANGSRFVTFLTPSENEMVWKMGLAALQDASAMDQVAELKRQNFVMEQALREICHAKVGKNKGDLITEIQKLALRSLPANHDEGWGDGDEEQAVLESYSSPPDRGQTFPVEPAGDPHEGQPERSRNDDEEYGYSDVPDQP